MAKSKNNEAEITPEEVTTPEVMNEAEIEKIRQEMMAKEAAYTYRMLHVFDNETVIVRGNGLNLQVSYASVSEKADLLLNEFVLLSDGGFTKEEIKTVNISNDSKIVVFVKDKDFLEIKYSDFNAELIEELVSEVKSQQ